MKGKDQFLKRLAEVLGVTYNNMKTAVEVVEKEIADAEEKAEAELEQKAIEADENLAKAPHTPPAPLTDEESSHQQNADEMKEAELEDEKKEDTTTTDV